MKAVYLLLVLLLIFSCKRQEEDNRIAEVHCDESLLSKDPLYLSATKLEIYDLQNNPSNSLKNNPFLSASRIQEKYEGLKAIENLNNPNADSVFNIYNIAKGYYIKGDAQYIALVKPQDQELTNAILFDNISHPTLRELYKKYNIKFVKEESGWGNNYLIVKTCELTNINAVAKEISNSGVGAAVPIQQSVTYWKNWRLKGAKIDIAINSTTGETEYDFSLGHGLGPSDYLFWSHWVFSVDKNNVAKFVRRYGPYPPPR